MDVDSKAATVTFKDTKNHTYRLMPITPRLAELLEAMKALKMGQYVFATVGKDGKQTHLSEPRKALVRRKRCCRKCGVDPWPTPDIRDGAGITGLPSLSAQGTARAQHEKRRDDSTLHPDHGRTITAVDAEVWAIYSEAGRERSERKRRDPLQVWCCFTTLQPIVGSMF
jgi:hypothetical protein